MLEKSKYLPSARFWNLNTFCSNALDENSVEPELWRQPRLWRQRLGHWSCQTARDSSRFNISTAFLFYLDFLEATAPKTTGLRNNVRSALQSQVHKLQSKTNSNSNRASNRNSILSNYYSLPRSSVSLNRSFENDNSSHNQNIELDCFEKSFEAEDSTLFRRSFSKNEGVVFPGSTFDLREGSNNTGNQAYSPGASVARTLLNKRFLGRSLKFTTEQASKIRERFRNESLRK